MKLPLHLNKNPHPSAVHDAMMRLEAHQHMQSLRNDNGGFRVVPTSRSGSKSRTKQLSNKPITRIERLAHIAYD